MIRLITFDMDGTFLNSQNDYDRPRFQKIFKKMQEIGGTDGGHFWKPILTDSFIFYGRSKSNDHCFRSWCCYRRKRCQNI